MNVFTFLYIRFPSGLDWVAVFSQWNISALQCALLNSKRLLKTKSLSLLPLFSLSLFKIRFMRISSVNVCFLPKMCRKLAKDLQDDLMEYTKRFVIVEMTDGQHRVVSRRYCPLSLSHLSPFTLSLLFFFNLPFFFHSFSLSFFWFSYLFSFSISREPLSKWEITVCPPNTRLMYVPIFGHFNFKVLIHLSLSFSYPTLFIAFFFDIVFRLNILPIAWKSTRFSMVNLGGHFLFPFYF